MMYLYGRPFVTFMVFFLSILILVAMGYLFVREVRKDIEEVNKSCR